MSKKCGRRRGRGRARPSGVTTSTKYVDQEKAEAEMEFAMMERVYAFTVDVPRQESGNIASATQNVKFRTGDDVILNSARDRTPDMWVGYISEIRVNRDKTKVLAKVRWYWSRNDIAALVRSFNPNCCSPYERILSDDYDYITPHAFQAVTYVHEYHEDDLDPPPIGPTTFFVRTTLLPRQPFTGPNRILQPSLCDNSCVCHESYNPYPLAAGNDPMHFCPRVGCRIWYHLSCLSSLKTYHDNAPPSTRGIRLLAVDPDSEGPFVTFAHFCEPDSNDSNPETEQLTIDEVLEFWDRDRSIISHLPPSLVAIAQSPIVRCSGGKNGWAIGNVADVVLARRFVYAALEHNGKLEESEKWKELLERERARQQHLSRRAQRGISTPDADVDMDRDRDLFGGRDLWGSVENGSRAGTPAEPDDVSALEGLAEDLSQFELLASVYIPYWDKRLEEYQAAAWLFDGTPLVCPQCESAM